MTKPRFNDTIYRDKRLYKATMVRRGHGSVVMIDPLDAPSDSTFLMADGPALRDALIKAFPLPGDEPLADWEKELLKGLAAKPKPAEPERLVPGTVWRGWTGSVYVTLPGDKVYVIKSGHRRASTYIGTVIPWSGRRGNAGEVVFDPRDAKALPSPLGVRVGDGVRRVQKGDHTTVTTEFQVNHIDRQIGHAYPKYGSGHPVDELVVTSREVPDRLPAGTIVRPKTGWSDSLRTEDGWITLKDGGVHKDSEARIDLSENLESIVRNGRADVIYLPES